MWRVLVLYLDLRGGEFLVRVGGRRSKMIVLKGYHAVVGGNAVARSPSGCLGVVVVVVIRRHLDGTSCLQLAREPQVEMVHLGGAR